MRAEIYYVEDEKDIAEGVAAYLEERDFAVRVFSLLSEAKQELLNKAPDVLLIDWNLPDGSGASLCEWSRRHFGDALPILFLTVREDTADVVEGFRCGADDYIAKPFALEVLLSRILAVLRRAKGERSGRLFCDGICLDTERLTVSIAGQETAIGPAEMRLLTYLMENKGKTVARGRLLETLWDAKGSYVNDNTLTVTMKRLREKLGNPACIKTVRSFGYRMEDTL